MNLLPSFKVTPVLWAAIGAVVVLLLMLVVGKLTFGRSAPRHRRGWTCGVVGLRGGGKTLFVMRLVAHRLRKGHMVCANFGLDPASVGGSGTAIRATEWLDYMLAPEGATVVIDEAHQWMPSAAGKSMDPEANWYMSHSRKLGHEVWWIAQHETQVPTKIREMTNEMVLCSETLTGHVARSYSPHGAHSFIKAGTRALWRWSYKAKGAATQVYDTFELVVPDPKNDPNGNIGRAIAEINRRRGVAA